MSGQRSLAGCATEAGTSVEGNVITQAATGTEVAVCVGADGVANMLTGAEVGA